MRTVATLAALLAAASICQAQAPGQEKPKPAAAGHDQHATVGATGLPAGMMGRVDRPERAKLADLKYTKKGSGWELHPGPSHIAYDPKATGSGIYGATATFELLTAPSSREAFGVFIGGQDLDKPTQRYTYFVVRHTGEFLVKERNGTETKDLIGWKADPSVPKVDAGGKGTYKLTAHVAKDTVHFSVNDKLVAALPKSGLSTEGVAGVRVNHNLHLGVTPVQIQK